MATKKWDYRIDNKLRGAFGETDLDKKTIRINAKKHKKGGYNIPKKDNTLINTMVHEDLHRKHPKMTEKMIRKITRIKLAAMTPRQKAKLRAKFKK